MRSLGGELVNPLWLSHLEQSDGASSATFVHRISAMIGVPSFFVG